MPLKLTLRLNLAWACLMLLAFLVLVVLGPSIPRLIVFVAALGYVGVSLAALHRSGWALLASVGVAAVLLARELPMVFVNFRMYIDDHSLYLDSPGTILIVAINALLFVIPALMLLILYVVQWRKVVALVTRTQAGAHNYVSKPTADSSSHSSNAVARGGLTRR